MMVMTAPPIPEATRDRVLRCAEALFARHGYAAVSMRELATACGVTKPALYYHFRDKESLFEECVVALIDRLGAELSTVVGATLQTRVARAAAILLDGHHPVRTQADVAEHLPHEARQRVADAWARHVTGPLTALFRRAAEAGELRPDVDPALATRALWGQVVASWPSMVTRDGGVFAMDRAGDDDAEARARSIADLTLRGVGS